MVRKSRKLLMGITIVAVVGVIIGSWLGLLYAYYGHQTFFFLVKAPPRTIVEYSKNIVSAPVSAPEPNSTQTTPDTTAPPVPTSHTIPTMSHMYQKLNNCGPSSVAMAASSYDITFDQFAAAEVLKGNDKDKNVSPTELVAFLSTQHLSAIHRVNGTPAQIEALVAQGIPVIVEQWLEKRGTGELVGHYRVVRGYNRQRQLFITNDSFNGPNFTIPYAQFEEWWRPFNRTYIPVYRPDQAETVRTILGSDWEVAANWQRASQQAQQDIQNHNDGYAYFNAGITAVALEKYPEAVAAFNKALTFSFPEHFLWYQFDLFEAYFQVGEYDKVLELTDHLLKEAGEVEEARYYRGLVFEHQGEIEKAKAEAQKAVTANPRYQPAQDLLTRLAS
ncbi:MAG TPA: C39 family peptidase [Vitreimonas sp.]|nr:C39 family peptidase [Vitreimonas sp.]